MHRVVFLSIAVAGATAALGQGQIANPEVIATGCIVTVGMNCPTLTGTTPTTDAIHQITAGATGSYSQSFTFGDGSSVTLNGQGTLLSPTSQQSRMSASVTGDALGEVSMQTVQLDTVTMNSSNPGAVGTLWFQIGVQVSSSGNSGFGANGGVNVGPAGLGIISNPTGGGVWGASFCESGAQQQGLGPCGSSTVESPHFEFRFGTPFTLNYNTTATVGLGPGNTTATATIMTTILGVYVLDANGNQLTSGVTATSAMGGAYNIVAAPLSSSSALPHFAAGGSWTTGITVVNSANQPANFSLGFYDDMGQLEMVPFGNSLLNDSFAGTVPALGSSYFELGNPAQPLTSGWIQITADPSITVQGVFRNAVNGTYYEAAIPSSAGSMEFVVPFDATTFTPTNTPNYTGIAIANLDIANSANLVCTALSQAGTPIPNAVAVPTIMPLGHWSNYLFPALAGQRGTIDCVSNTKIAALGLQFIGTNTFSTLPVIMK